MCQVTTQDADLDDAGPRRNLLFTLGHFALVDVEAHVNGAHTWPQHTHADAVENVSTNSTAELMVGR